MASKTASESKALARTILTARTEADVSKLLSEANSHGIRGARAIGDREVNAGTVEIASNPYSAITERITNAIDAVLEYHAQKLGLRTIEDWDTPPANPREAARTLLDLPKAGMTDLQPEERRELAENVVVMLDESGVSDRPTIIVQDNGIGQHPLQMPDGLLSLNRDNKLRKPWQHGSYGQGGSAPLRFSPYTIIVSRKAPDLLENDEHDVVGWTVAYRDEGDPYKEALPVYRYLVGEDDEVPTFDPHLLPDPDWHGTRIVHIAYDLSKYSAAYTQLQNGVWGMFHALLFDPVLPFIVGGRRQIDLNAAKGGAIADDDMSDLVIAKGDSNRVVVGNRRRLDQGPKGGDPEIAWHGSEERDLSKAHGEDLGTLRVHYWVVRRPIGSERKTDPTLSYVSASNAVSVTLNGQQHDAERRSWLKEKLKLPYLNKNLIVQVDIDDLSPPAKRKLFSSTRERMVDGPMKDLVYEETVSILSSDQELRRLEREMRERAMSKGAEQIADRVREKLGKFVNTFLKGKTKKIKVPDTHEEVVGPPRGKNGNKSEPRSTEDSHLPAAPTDMKFARDPITITRGKRTTVWVHLDAKNGYLRRHGDDLSVSFSPELGGKVQDVGKSELLAGKSMWTLQADIDAPIGTGEVEATLVTPNGVLSASAKVKVIAAPTQSKQKKRDKEVPVKGPNIVWVRRDEWDDDFNEKTVGQVNIGTDETDIRVNRHHPLIDAALENKSLSRGEMDNKGNRYLFAIGCGLFRQEYAFSENGSRPEQEHIDAEQERMAEAVLIAIDDKLIELDD